MGTLPEQLSVIPPILDDNTSESIMYGSSYKFVKSSKYYWDAMEYEVANQIEYMKTMLLDLRFCRWAILPENRDMIMMDVPPVDTVQKIRDLRTLKEIWKLGTVLRDIDVRRTENIMYGKLTGISEYSRKMMADGISDYVWKSAVLGFNEPIEYETIRDKLDEEEKVAYFQARQTAQLEEEKAHFKKEYEEYLESVRKAEDEKMKESPKTDLKIIKEIEVEDKDEEPSERFCGLICFLEGWNVSPIDDLICWMGLEVPNQDAEAVEVEYELPEDEIEIPSWYGADNADLQDPAKVGILRRLFSKGAKS